MSDVLRILLLIGSLGTAVIIIRKTRKCRIHQEDTLFWICFAVFLALLGIFPDISYKMSSLIGIISPANFIFLIIIALLVEKLLSLSVQVSMLEKNVAELAAELAIRTKDLGERVDYEIMKSEKFDSDTMNNETESKERSASRFEARCREE